MTTQLLDSEIKYDRNTRDYAILIAGVAVGFAATYSQAETIRTQALAERHDEGLYNAIALDAFQQELIETLDPSDGPAGPEPDDIPGADPSPGRCRNCDGAHHIQRCPEVWAAMRATNLRIPTAEDYERDRVARAWSQQLLDTMKGGASTRQTQTI